MKNGFYMGYDASGMTPEALLRQARLLLDGGWYAAGYNTVCLGLLETDEKDAMLRTAAYLRAVGFRIGITVPAGLPSAAVQEEAARFGAGMVTVVHRGDREQTQETAAAVPEGLRRAVLAKEADLPWAARCADTVILPLLTPDSDFFEVTRHQLDSCRDGDTSADASAANLRAGCLLPGGTYLPGPLPTRFDYYRNEAVFLQLCMLGCPLVLRGDLGSLPKAWAELVQNESLLHMAGAGAGRVLRYYDPWHVLLGKADGDRYAWALILNRCHGDQPTNLLPKDLGWEGRFALRLCPENTLAGAMLESYEAHVETSDHPQTPCCRLLRAERL